MAIMGGRHCIIESDSSKGHLYLNDKNNLIYETIFEDGSTTREIVAENIKAFDTAYAAAEVRVFCCTPSGHMLLCRHDGRSWVSKDIYDYSKAGVDISDVRILAENSEIHLAYILSQKSGSQVVFHHHWDGNKWANASISVPDGMFIEGFCLASDKSGKLHIMMIGCGEEQYRILYTRFDNGAWSVPETVCLERERIHDLSMYMVKGSIHAIWCRCQNEHQQLMYSRDSGRGWEQPVVLAEYEGYADETAMLYDSKALIAQWNLGGEVQQYISNDGGMHWQPTGSIHVQDDVVKCKYLSQNNDYMRGDVSVFAIKGTWDVAKADYGVIRAGQQRGKTVDDEVHVSAVAAKPADDELGSLKQQMALLVDLYTDIKGMLLRLQPDAYVSRTASLRDVQAKKQMILEISQLRQINEDIMRTSMHLQERNQLLERSNQALGERIDEYERIIEGLKTENEALKKQLLDQMKNSIKG